MITVTILGTGGMTPLPNRHLSSCMVRYNGINFLIDCGEGTQIAIKKAGYSLKKIDYIFLTHFHTDHVSGLSGLLASMSNSDKTTPLTIVGPKGLGRIVDASRKLVSKLPFIVKTIEINEAKATLDFDGLQITPFPVEHKIPCFGYSFYLKREGKCDPMKAAANNVPVEVWSELQEKQMMKYEGRILTKDLIMNDSRKGIKFVYTTDTRPCKNIVNAAKDADLFVCEGMYGDDMLRDNADKNLHMTMQEAAMLAAQSGVKQLILTHFSPSMPHPDWYLKDLLYTFHATTIGADGLTCELNYED